MTTPIAALPAPADFASPPSVAARHGWDEADRAARPARLQRLRDRFANNGVDAYFGVRPENARYLTGLRLRDGEEKVAGTSGQFIVGVDEVVLFADSRYAIQAAREAHDARIETVYNDLAERWPALIGSVGAKRVAVEAGFVSHATWARLATAAPNVELVAVEGWIETDRATKEPTEIERVAAACAVADRALAGLLPTIRPGMTERELALDLELRIRSGGADALAFDVACLAGPEAALPHGSPADRPIRPGQVLLFDFGAKVDGYRSDMTRTLFVGEPAGRDLEIYELVAAAQTAAITGVDAALRSSRPISGREVDGLARQVVNAAGHGEQFGHGTGHGIGLATHELPTLGKRSPETPLPSPTVFSIEPGVYLEGQTGVRIEDLFVYDATARHFERLTNFPREIVVVGT
jgi:Xaa-Pro aminopeptidase